MGPGVQMLFPTRYELEGLAQFMFFGDLSEIRGSRLIQDVSPRNLQDNPIMGRRTHFRAPGGAASCLSVCKYWARWRTLFAFFRLLQFCTVKFETLPYDHILHDAFPIYFPTRYELEGLAQFMFFDDLSEIRGSRLILDVSQRNLQDNPILVWTP